MAYVIRNPQERLAVTEYIDGRIGDLQEERSGTLSKFEHKLLSKHIDELLKWRSELCGNPKSPFVS